MVAMPKEKTEEQIKCSETVFAQFPQEIMVQCTEKYPHGRRQNAGASRKVESQLQVLFSRRNKHQAGCDARYKTTWRAAGSTNNQINTTQTTLNSNCGKKPYADGSGIDGAWSWKKQSTKLQWKLGVHEKPGTHCIKTSPSTYLTGAATSFCQKIKIKL